MSERITLADGRVLGCAEYGDPQGKPLLYFHGFPSSRRGGSLADPVANRLGVRIIAPDRPGFGISHFLADRTIPDWPDDVVQLADALDLERFAVVGISGGGPYAAACAWKIPERLTAVGIVCGLGPLHLPGSKMGLRWNNRLFWFLAGKAPWILPPLLRAVARSLGGDRKKFLQLVASKLPAPDRDALSRPEVADSVSKMMLEAFHDGVRGAHWEARLYARPWGFPLEEISIPVYLWQGEMDRNVSPAMGRYLAEAIPDCRARFYPDEGHFSLPVNHREEILRTLLA